MTARTIRLSFGLLAALFVLSAGTAWWFRETVRTRLAVPNKELDEELAKWRAQRKRTRRGDVTRPE